MTVRYECCEHCDRIRIVEVVCNRCGVSCKVDQDGHPGFYGLLKAEVHGGYYSPVLQDMTRYRFSMCERCLKELFGTFAVPVEEQEVDATGCAISRNGIQILEPSEDHG